MQNTLISQILDDVAGELKKLTSEALLDQIGQIPLNLPKDQLLRALSHRSFIHEIDFKLESNEKLEFLGDSVIELWSAKTLVDRYPAESEGVLSKLRSSAVNKEALGLLCKENGLNRYMLLGKGEYMNGGLERDSLCADLFEALVGAHYLAFGVESAFCFIEESVSVSKRDPFDRERLGEFDFKTKLQEVIQAKLKTLPEYTASKNPKGEFEVSLLIKDKLISSTTNISKKKAMQDLAKEHLIRINHDH